MALVLIKIYLFIALASWLLTMWALYFDVYERVSEELANKHGVAKGSANMHAAIIIGTFFGGLFWPFCISFNFKARDKDEH